MINQAVRIPLDPSDGATLFIFGDLQWGASGFDANAWLRFVDIFKSTPNAWALGLGDYGDFLRPSMRSRIQGQYAHDQSARRQQDDLVRRNQDDLIEMMAFLEGRLIGLHEGHHVWEFATGDNSDMRLATALKADFLGWQAATRITFDRTDRTQKNGTSPAGSFTIVSLHGTGNSRFTGTDSRWLDNNIVPQYDADLFAKGHACKSDAWSPFKKCRIRRQGPPGLEDQVVRCLNVPGFCDGYTNGWESTYAERFGFQRQALGHAEVRFKRVKRKAEAQAKGLGKQGRNQAYADTLAVEHLVVNY